MVKKTHSLITEFFRQMKMKGILIPHLMSSVITVIVALVSCTSSLATITSSRSSFRKEKRNIDSRFKAWKKQQIALLVCFTGYSRLLRCDI